MSSSSDPEIALEQVLERMADIALQIHQLSNLDEVFNCIVGHARALLRSDRVLIYQFSSIGRGRVRAESTEVENSSSLAELLTHLNHLEQWFMVSQQEYCVIEDIHTTTLQPEHREFLIQLQVRASLAVSILFQDQVWGALIAHEFYQARQWQSLDIQLLKQITLQLGIAIQQSDFQQKLQNQVNDPSRLAKKSLYRNSSQECAIVEDQTEMIARFASDSTLLFINEAYCRYFGVQREDMVGKSYKPVIYEPDQEAVAQRLQLLSPENPTITIENRVINAQGEIRWTQWVNRMLINESGGEVEFQTVGRDITELKQSEIELRTVRDRLQYLLTYAPAVLFTRQPSGDYGTTFISNNVKTLLGYESHNFTDNPRFWLDHVHPADVDQILAGIPQVFIKNNHRHEFRFLHANGSYRWISEELTAIRDQIGQPIELVGYLIDVSDRKAIQDALYHSEERFRIVQELSLDAFTILKSVRDQRGTIIDFEWTYVNPRAAEILKHPISELIGHRLLEVLPGNQENSELFKQYVQVAETGVSHDIELFYDAEGITGWFRNMTVQLEDGIAISFSDITSRKQAEAALQESAERLQEAVIELEELNQTKDEFLSTVSHELRTPMTNIKMSIRMLELTLSQPHSQQRDEKVGQYLQILSKECNREINLINDLLDLQHLEAGKKKTTLETIDFKQWLVAFIQPFQNRALERQQSLVLELPNIPMPNLCCDIRSLERIVSELLNNACKYTPPGQQIIVTAQLTGEQLQIQVVNFGVEIPAQALPHIFDRFYRVPSADPWQQGGTGLGLALVKKLVEYLDGSIQVESHSGYTCFQLILGIPTTESSGL